jgi:hypothetical protein
VGGASEEVNDQRLATTPEVSVASLAQAMSTVRSGDDTPRRCDVERSADGAPGAAVSMRSRKCAVLLHTPAPLRDRTWKYHTPSALSGNDAEATVPSEAVSGVVEGLWSSA